MILLCIAQREGEPLRSLVLRIAVLSSCSDFPTSPPLFFHSRIKGLIGPNNPDRDLAQEFRCPLGAYLFSNRMLPKEYLFRHRDPGQDLYLTTEFPEWF